jgi:hypothetical protein
MTAPFSEDPEVDLIAGLFYEYLIATTRSKDVAHLHLRRAMARQKATDADFNRLSVMFAGRFLSKVREVKASRNSELTEAEIEALKKECTEYVISEYAKD